MEREPNWEPIELTGIHINLEAQAIEFEDRQGTVGRVRCTAETVLYEGRPLLLSPSGDPDPTPDSSPQPRPEPPAHPALAPRLSHNSSPTKPRERF